MFDTDDDDFTLSPSSKLSSIFNRTSISDEGNPSLKYKAPKQPKFQESTTKVSVSNVSSEITTQVVKPSVVLAKVVTLWKNDDGKNVSLGKYMSAIIGNTSSNLFELIIYQDKTKILIREALGKLFSFFKYPNNFVGFYDSGKQLWNLNFENFVAINEFLSQCSKIGCYIIDQDPQDANDERELILKGMISPLNESPHESSKSSEDISSNKNNKTKEKIMSKITKMGKSILPKMEQSSKDSDLSDSETESSYSHPSIYKPAVAPRKARKITNSHNKALTPIASERNNSVLQNNNFTLPNNNQVMLNPSNMGIMYSQPMPDYGLSNFIMAQNAELKANLAEINMKLNNVLGKADKNGNSQDDCGSLSSRIKVQNLKIDNLMDELEKRNKELETLNIKYKEKCEEVKKNGKESEEIDNLSVEVDCLRKKIEGASILEKNLNNVNKDLNEKIENLLIKIKDYEDYSSIKLFNEDLQKENENLREKLQEASLKVAQCEEQLKQKDDDISKIVQDNNQSLDKERVSKIVKESMNEAFRSIMKNFEENGTYAVEDIQRALLENLKKSSFKLINSLA